MTKHDNKPIWNPHFYINFAGYESILPFLQKQAASFLTKWPQVEDFNEVAKHLPFSFFLQDQTTRYNQEIYHNKKIPMREHSWHDFFNNISWLLWPKLKYAIITRINQEYNQINSRTKRQDLLTHFDECGVIIVSDETFIFDLIKEYKWKELFFHTKDVRQKADIITFGHGLLEKGLAPYIGMTGKVLFFKTTKAFFSLSYEDKMKTLDEEMAAFVLSDDFPESPRALAPFPLLGWPGWWPGNDQETFFDNKAYFRDKPPTK